MKTFDFTILPHRLRASEPNASVDGNVENGWEAYAAWLRQLREQASERRTPLPPDLIP